MAFQSEHNMTINGVNGYACAVTSKATRLTPHPYPYRPLARCRLRGALPPAR